MTLISVFASDAPLQLCSMRCQQLQPVQEEQIRGARGEWGDSVVAGKLPLM